MVLYQNISIFINLNFNKKLEVAYMDRILKSDIIIYTLLQELKRESNKNKNYEIRLFCKNLLEKVNFELDNWDRSKL